MSYFFFSVKNPVSAFQTDQPPISSSANRSSCFTNALETTSKDKASISDRLMDGTTDLHCIQGNGFMLQQSSSSRFQCEKSERGMQTSKTLGHTCENIGKSTQAFGRHSQNNYYGMSTQALHQEAGIECTINERIPAHDTILGVDTMRSSRVLERPLAEGHPNPGGGIDYCREFQEYVPNVERRLNAAAEAEFNEHVFPIMRDAEKFGVPGENVQKDEKIFGMFDGKGAVENKTKWRSGGSPNSTYRYNYEEIPQYKNNCGLYSDNI